MSFDFVDEDMLIELVTEFPAEPKPDEVIREEMDEHSGDCTLFLLIDDDDETVAVLLVVVELVVLLAFITML